MKRAMTFLRFCRLAFNAGTPLCNLLHAVGCLPPTSLPEKGAPQSSDIFSKRKCPGFFGDWWLWKWLWKGVSRGSEMVCYCACG
jgi:hypothetical protein